MGEYYVFTFGSGQKHEGYYVRIYGDAMESREKMIDKYGIDWCFQYSEEQWEKWKKEAKRFDIPIEKELEVIP